MDVAISFTTTQVVAPPPQLPHREIGACVEFWGIVRELEKGHALSGLMYEAHEGMAVRQLHRIFSELHVVHPCEGVTFIHRLGWVPVGEASLYLRVQARHRGEALHFCGDAIDRMKEDVPIWKRSDSSGV